MNNFFLQKINSFKKFEIMEIFYDLLIIIMSTWVVKLFQSVTYDDHDDFQHVNNNFIFFTNKFISLF
jgi:hypothetical protein